MNRQLNRRFYGQIALTLFLIGCMLLWVRPAHIQSIVSGANLFLLGLGLSLTPVVIAIKGLRWWLLIRTVSRSVTFREGMSSYLAGLALATVTPFGVGEAGRGLFIVGGNGSLLIGKTILDKVIDFSMVILFAAVGLIILGDEKTSIVGLVFLCLLLSGWILIGALLPRLMAKAGSFYRLQQVLLALATTSRRQLLVNGVLALIGFGTFYLQAFVLLRAVWPATTWMVLPTFPIITFSTILPIAVGGIGIREWTAVLLLTGFNIPAEAAFAAFFGHFIIVQLIPALLGVPIIVVHWQSSRTRARQGI
jgi:uncharacterized membrane protein YbhN (UPF0104 family)